ncbi:ATP-dependent DNA helicase [Corynebacterium sp. ES2794-CONJ1]|uniref:RecQ family ATP-dependent DNA helicase n=1 Tax=unclassified Corynebacterium TaxID=2624378 RepID=UPI002166F6F6|nr:MULTISPECIES: ATP-dependent DNA helicase RecQ [unclassified Corynebacterium]MCS4489788.1 ATP-dependent DNA helicase [Corynebacterium sp. ES2775-CONJ]MCU9519354.1 ATP-dependent DNA helicase [Corynebacterium sp. ES2794-CONJ1]
MSIVSQASATNILRRITGDDDHHLHPDQWDAIDALVNGHQRLLVVQRTGWGKSAVYFIAAQLLRDAGGGPAVIISPLLALMRNQIEAAQRAGIQAVTLNSANIDEWGTIASRLRDGDIDILLVSPERLNNLNFREELLPRLATQLSLLVIDEAHCISDWGHDFRPDYRRIKDLIPTLNPATPVLATTATANNRVVGDISAQLGEETTIMRGSLARRSLYLNVLHLPDSSQRAAWIATHIQDLSGSGIVYCLTIAAAEELGHYLRSMGYQAATYTGRTEAAERELYEQQLLNNELKVLVATSALGMGFDKPDLGFVIHYGAPSSPISYYQHIGRAGRNNDQASIILLPGTEDQAIWEYFAKSSLPDASAVEPLMQALSQADTPLTVARLENSVNLSRGRIEQTLKILSVDHFVEKTRSGWIRTSKPFTLDLHKNQALKETRAKEAQAMLDYIETSWCRELYLRKQLDDMTATEPCGRCDNCRNTYLDPHIDTASLEALRAAAAQSGVDISVRKRWPAGVTQKGPILGIAGIKALDRLSSLTHGTLLRQILHDKAWPFAARWQDDPLLALSVSVLQDWEWEYRPRCVVVLENPHPDITTLLHQYAQCLADIGNINFSGVLKLHEGARDVDAHNSTYRVRALTKRWNCDSLGEVIGPVLLISDVVDTSWSVTVAASELHEHYGVQVLGLVLATHY